MSLSAVHQVLHTGGMIERLAVGTVLGFLIGFERQWRRRPAGLQTSSLVTVGAALFATIAPSFGLGSDLRILANIVTGVGFLAGGVILRDGMTVSGLNTAATLWSAAAVGALAGVGLFYEASVGAVAIVGLNFFMGPLAERIDRHRGRRHASNESS